jgi:hypothetical protein
MRVGRKRPEGRRGRSYRRLLGRLLLGGVLFELSLLAGGLAAPLIEGWTPQPSGSLADPATLLAEWRHSVAPPEAELTPGQPAPPLTLRTSRGASLNLAALRGKKVVLLFAKGDSG